MSVSKPLVALERQHKTGKKTVAAIMAFQEMEGLPITGKVDPHGQCISKLKAKTPNIVGKKIEHLAIGAPATGQAAHTPVRHEAKAHNQKLAAEILTKWPLPTAQAKDIAACVSMVGEKLGVALEPDTNGPATHSVKVNTNGIFTVDLKQKGTSGAAISPHDRDNPAHKTRDAMKGALHEFAMPFPGRLTCRAKTADPLFTSSHLANLVPNAKNAGPIVKALSDAAKANTGSSPLMKTINDTPYLPQTESASLAKVINDCTAKCGIPFAPEFAGPVDVTRDGCFQVSLKLDDSGLPNGPEAQKWIHALTKTVCDEVAKSPNWRRGATDLTFTCTKPRAALAGLPQLDPKIKSQLPANVRNQPVAHKVAAATQKQHSKLSSEALHDTGGTLLTAISSITAAAWAYLINQIPEAEHKATEKAIGKIFKRVDVLYSAGKVFVTGNTNGPVLRELVGEVSTLLAGWAINEGVLLALGGVLTGPVGGAILALLGGAAVLMFIWKDWDADLKNLAQTLYDHAEAGTLDDYLLSEIANLDEIRQKVLKWQEQKLESLGVYLSDQIKDMLSSLLPGMAFLDAVSDIFGLNTFEGKSLQENMVGVYSASRR